MKFLSITSIFILLKSTTCFAENLDLSCFANEISLLANHKTIRDELIHYNAQPIDVLAIEREWQSLPLEAPEVSKVLLNPANQVIKKYIKEHSIDGEGFLIGANGGLVAATNKTTDFYQADEKQFSEPFKLPFGEAWIKPGIIDESAGALLIKVAVPVFPSDQTLAKPIMASPQMPIEQPIGVLVIGLYEFVISMSESCEVFESDD
ncbi:hypothetical protein TDB9533_00011 [Thalassocella blandensis]|nr:hypothetical protein TDB9533_00011 [Thalassocella blandensis]